MKTSTPVAAALAVAAFATGSANATLVQWTDWTAATPGLVTGTITSGLTTVNVTYTGDFYFVQTSGGTNYWTEGTPAPYTGGTAENAPPAADIIALGNGGLKTITFSQAVTDPYLALVSWNGNSGTFTQPFDIISQGCGYWGCGSFGVSGGAPYSSFTGSGELHGLIRFSGTFSSVSFTDNNEFWHGIQVGIAGLAPTAVPEPSSAALLLGALGLLGWSVRRGKLGRG